MISSGIKRGLAASAVSALAVAGLPLLATSASATPIATQVGNADGVEFYSQQVPGISAKNDGTNTTVSLVTGGGANVTSVAYQYTTSAAPATWVDVPGGLVARNADGVFAADWTGVPANVAQVRAVPNTGLANAVVVTAPTIVDATANTVELASEGSLGVFQAPYGAGRNGDYVGVTGTVSQGSTAPNVTDASAGTAGADTTTLETTTSTTSDTFNSVLDIDGYPYSTGSEPNQIAINAATNNTDDAEGSTLYVQTIGSITATPATQDRVDPTTAEITLTVLDTQGKPVAGAQVYRGSADTDTDGGGADTDTDGPETLVGYTDGRGQVKDTTTTGAATYGYYVNTTGNTAYEPAVDKATTATVTTYTPAFTTIAIQNERSRTNFDIDELSDSDDFTIVTTDQKNAPIANIPVEYRYIIDPSGVGATYTSPYVATVSDANGEVVVPGLTDASYNGAPVPPGTYTIEARRPNVNGTGLQNATPVTVNESESEITYSEGASANAPINGDFTVTGNLANTDGNLAGRLVSFTYNPGVGGDATTAPQSEQPAGTTITAPGQGTAITDANGNFSVKLRDQGVPPNVTPTPESGTFTATATGEDATDGTSLKGNLGTDGDTEAASLPNAPANASQSLTVNFQAAATVTSIDVNLDEIYGGVAAPGRPVDLDIVVHGADGDANPNNDPALQDTPVTITVDKGFLSPNAETAQDVTLASGHDSTGDLWGFFKNDGTSKTVSTGDSAEAGAIAAIERDPGFDDDGLVDMVVTVKAGNTTVTRTISFDDRFMLNQGASTLERAAGAPQGDVNVGEEVPFQLYVHDQFGNLVGDQDARISDDSTVADFRTDGDFDSTRSDFTTNGPGIVAFSNAPAVQTLMAAMQPGEVLVDANDDPDSNSKNVSVKSDPINWVNKAKPSPELTLKGSNDGKTDVLFANAATRAHGATVKLYKRANGAWKLVGTATLNKFGNHHFRVADKNGKKITKYKAVAQPTARTTSGTGTKSLR
ncbi:MAG: hypothetical protein JWO76_1455 [Nocardioides sp.]|nr:hypothetical protein [Nocardioides sp.]